MIAEEEPESIVQYVCERCNKTVGKLVPIDDADRSAWESATTSAQLEVPYPSTYTEYVCIACAKETLGITDGDLIREERAARVETDFQVNLLKGRLGQVIVETVFQEFGYEVYPYGYESYLTNIIKFMRKSNPNIPVRKTRATPDLFVYDRELNDGFFLEVKATGTPDESAFWIRRFTLETYQTYWPEAVLVVDCVPSMNIYCRPIGDIPIDQLPVEQSPAGDHQNCVIDLKSSFLTLPGVFRLIDPVRFQGLCRRIQDVLTALAKPAG